MTAERINWDQIRERLATNAKALDELFVPNAMRNKKVFQERAERMAARVAAMTRLDTVSVVIFQLGTERFCLPISELAEIIPFQNCNPVPGVSRELCGVIAVRGEIRSVMDLAAIVGMVSDVQEPSYILLLRGHDVGLRVGLVQKVASVQQTLAGSSILDDSQEPLSFLDLQKVFDHNIFHEHF